MPFGCVLLQNSHMATCFRRVARFSLLVLNSSPCNFLSPRLIFHTHISVRRTSMPLHFPHLSNSLIAYRYLSYGTVNLVLSEGKPKFEVQEVDPPKKAKWKTKKRLKLQRMREKQKRKAANRRDPRRLTAKKKKQKFASVEERIKYKLEQARIKEALLVERLKKYEVPKVQGPIVKPHELTGEEKFYFKKMAQKRSNYVPIGRRGVFGGVILNMHLHWKKHETVKVFFKPCKPGQIHEYVREIERLSGGIAIQIIGDDTAIFYRGKNYVQPEVMSPIDTLSKKRALEKSKYEQSLETVRHYIAVAEKELELYYRHIALYGSNSNNQNQNVVTANSRSDTNYAINVDSTKSEIPKLSCCSTSIPKPEYDSTDEELTDSENESLSELDIMSDDWISGDEDDPDCEESRSSFRRLEDS
uniref:CRM domain-containing protein n=1 Tax=Opuntia streptacantha TaxID=393608 RepID=A0A7C9A3U1_OPUST